MPVRRRVMGRRGREMIELKMLISSTARRRVLLLLLLLLFLLQSQG